MRFTRFKSSILASFSLLACDQGAPEGHGYAERLAGLGSSLVINEFQAGAGGFIEIYNPTSAAIDASGWRVDDIESAGTAPKSLPANTTIPAKGRFAIGYGGVNTSSADEVRLSDASGALVDMHSNFHAGTSIAGKCFGRSPDGGSWSAVAILCSSGLPNANVIADGDADIVVNEFGPGPAGWIELYNRGTVEEDLSGWAVDDVEGGTGKKTLGSGSSIGPKGFLFVNYGGINTASADEVRVLDPAGTEVDSMSNHHVSGSITNKCFGRFPDGGAVSDAALSCSGDAPNAEGSGPTPAPSTSLVVNEVRAGASGWVELYNSATTAANLDGYTIDDIAGGGSAPKKLAAGTVIAAKGFVLVPYTGVNSASADEVRLVAPGGAVLDAHPNGYAGTSIAAVCFGRVADGGTWETSSRPCSPGSTNGATVAAALRINEFGPGPDGFIEVKNMGTTTIDLAGWKADDAAGGTAAVAFPGGLLLPPGEFFYTHINTISATSADEIRLIDPSGKVVDSRKNYVGEDPCPGICFGRVPDGGAWAAYAIPCSGGGPNPETAETPCLPGKACEDGSACTSGNVCNAQCVCGSPVICNDNNPCTTEACYEGNTMCLSSSIEDGGSCGSGLTCDAGECRGATGGANLVLNELSPGPDGWVEVMNIGNKAAFLGGYLLRSKAGTGHVTVDGQGYYYTSVPPNGRLVVPFGVLSATGPDFLRLLSGYGQDEVEATTNFWTTGTNVGKCFGRLPDGTGSFAGKSIACTKGASNGPALTVCTVGGACDDGNACTVGTKFNASCVCQGGAVETCDDGDPCTDDECHPAQGCLRTFAINYTICNGSKVCISGVCQTDPPCAASGGTYKGITFTKSEECTAVSFMNKARYSQMHAVSSFSRNLFYGCDGLTRTCGGYRWSRWSTLAELIDLSGTSSAGVTTMTDLKTASKGYTPSGLWYDTIANTLQNKEALSGVFVSFESVYVSSLLGNSCAIVRESPGATQSITMCIQGCFSDGGCEQLPAKGDVTYLRGRLVYEKNFFAGARWILSGSTMRPANPSF